MLDGVTSLLVALVAIVTTLLLDDDYCDGIDAAAVGGKVGDGHFVRER